MSSTERELTLLLLAATTQRQKWWVMYDISISTGIGPSTCMYTIP